MGLVDIINSAFYNKTVSKPVVTQNKVAINAFVATQQVKMQSASNAIMTKYLYAQPTTQKTIGLVRGYITATVASSALKKATGTGLTPVQQTAIVQATAKIQTSPTNLAQQQQAYTDTIQQQLDLLRGSLSDFQAKQAAAAFVQASENPATASGGIDWMSMIPMALVAMILMAGIGVLKK